MDFVTRPSPRIAFGPGMLEKLPEFIKEIGGSKTLIVTDEGIRAAGHADRTLSILEKANCEALVFDGVQENPTNHCISNCRDFAREAGVDFLIGLGGGSSMDTAKGCNFLLTNGGEMKDYHGYGKATHPMLPFIAVPTTSGTGSECQSYALVSDDETHVKMACGDAKALAQVALLDPELTASQPKLVASLTGLDALAHAVETAVCIPRNPISNIHSLEAFRLLARSIHSLITGTALPEDRSNMLLGAALAGLAIENSMLGAAHACANPLTAFFDVTHGHAVSLMLPYVIRFNRLDPEVDEIYRSYESFIPASGEEKNDMADWLDTLKETAGLKSLSEMGIGVADIKRLAAGASQQWTGRFNPRPLGLLDFEAIYSSAISDVVGSV